MTEPIKTEVKSERTPQEILEMLRGKSGVSEKRMPEWLAFVLLLVSFFSLISASFIGVIIFLLLITIFN